MLQGFKPEVIVTDLKMPEVDGRALIGYLESFCSFDLKRIIVISGYLSEDVREFLDQKSIRYYEKPFDPDDLVQYIEEIIPVMSSEKGVS